VLEAALATAMAMAATSTRVLGSSTVLPSRRSRSWWLRRSTLMRAPATVSVRDLAALAQLAAVVVVVGAGGRAARPRFARQLW
jgi:hypothetical protein